MGNLLNSTPLARVFVKSNCVSSCCNEQSISYTPCPKCKGRGSVRKIFEKSLNYNIDDKRSTTEISAINDEKGT